MYKKKNKINAELGNEPNSTCQDMSLQNIVALTSFSVTAFIIRA
jgi:hypothetical protein